MSDADRVRWDDRYARSAAPVGATVALPPRLAAYAEAFPHAGCALDLASGQGGAAVWLAGRGLDVLGVDVSPVAIAQATEAAAVAGVAARCRFAVWDLDAGLPAGPPADVVVCHRFRDARLDRAIVARLAPGGLLAVVALSEVGAAPGRFRVAPGALRAAFADLDLVAAGEGDGEAWLLARR